MCKLLTLIAAIMLGVSTQVFAEPQPIAVDGGILQGTTQGNVDVWLGIPYAAPPVGDLRLPRRSQQNPGREPW